MRNAATKTKISTETTDTILDFQDSFQKPNAKTSNATQRKNDAKVDKKN